MIYHKSSSFYWAFNNTKYCNCDVESSVCTHRKRIDDDYYYQLCIVAVDKYYKSK